MAGLGSLLDLALLVLSIFWVAVKEFDLDSHKDRRMYSK